MCNSKQTNERSSGKGCISPYFVNCKYASTKKEERTPWLEAKNTNYYWLTKKEKQTNQEHQNQTESFGSGTQMTRTEILSWDKAWTPEWSNILIQNRSHMGKKKEKKSLQMKLSLQRTQIFQESSKTTWKCYVRDGEINTCSCVREKCSSGKLSDLVH